MVQSETSDQVLMLRFRASSDPEAIRALVLRHHRGALAMARGWLGNTAAAEDAVQEAFIRVVRDGERYDASRPFAPWFWRILRNTVLDRVRSAQRYERRLRALAADRVPASASAPEPDGAEELLATLDAEDRDVLSLRFAAGLSFAAIAARLGCSEETAKKRGQRALARLRTAWRRRAAAPDPALAPALRVPASH